MGTSSREEFVDIQFLSGFDEDASVHSYEKWKNLKTENTELKKLCSKFLRNLKNLPDIKTKENEHYDKYYYLVLCIYGKLSYVFSSLERKHGIYFSELSLAGN
ncbi:PIR Superfamily Protein [Plasmodium ovale wallikeri]|uniref:PIR Superfamily Protein n=1 Tax=Plasmodium ovale wallikeri TaxID=864142 RepID=A0A1A9AT66_PLAOA|nr:PIR Superfamily Protein [Plasmodium ovale wallikeri]SBT59453.1 PIR Superfamily Protein [Plasmodium ovale wallikeri]